MHDPAYIELSLVQVAAAAALILVNGLVSLALRLGLERSLTIAALRTVLQLSLIGLVLEWVFQLKHPLALAAIMAVMTGVAALTAWQRTERRYRGILANTIISIWASSWIVLAFAMLGVLRETRPWESPQYTIPLLGMILGNTLNGITLGLNAVTENLATRRDQVETLLAFGATRWEAAAEPIRQAVRTGMVPIINSMMVVGLVSMPGMMTGQLLAGADPLDAVKYQIVIMFLIASATAVGVVLVVLLCYRQLFTADHQFRRELTQQKRR